MANVFNSLQNLSRSAANFSWALSVFGLSQATKAARDLSTGSASGNAVQSFDQAVAVLKSQLAGSDTALYRAGESAIAAGFGVSGSPTPVIERPVSPPAAGRGVTLRGGPGVHPSSPIPPGRTDPPLTMVPGKDAKAAPSEAAEDFFPAVVRNAFAEEVFSVYNVGTGTVDAQGTLINLNVDMFDLEGRWVGIQTGTQADYSPSAEVLPLGLAVPPPPALPIDQPPVPNPTRISYTQGVWTFNDGSAIFAQGPSWTHLIPLKNGAFMFMVTTSHVITRGTGRFEGIQGIKQGTGSTYVEPGLVQEGKFPAPGVQFTAKVIDTFRFVRKGFLDIPALGGRAAKVHEKPGGRS
jgi:hypothetical protein